MHVSWRWIVFVLRGVIAIAAGITAFTISVDAAKMLFAAYFVVDGVLTIVLAVRLAIPRRSRLLIGADGIIDLVVAGLFFAYAPNTTILILAVALWAIATGVLEFFAALFIPKIPALSWGIALVGIASCAVGIVVIDWTNLAEIGLLYFFATYAIIAGGLFVSLGIILARAFHRERTTPSS